MFVFWATLLVACTARTSGSSVSVGTSAELAAALRHPGVDTVALRGEAS